MIYLLLILATLLTSLISGVLSMAGGMILMGVFGFFLPVPAAMVLHGVAQAFSNGSRMWLYREHIHYGVLGPYFAGAVIVLAAFIGFSIVPNKGVMFLLVGLLPLLAILMPPSLHLRVERKPVAFVCGILVTAAQMLAGASGPILNVFYINSDLNRYEVLATKAVTQTLGHVIKLIYYAFFVTLAVQLPAWFYPAIIAAAIGGNWVAGFIVERMQDDQFRSIGRYVVAGIALVYIGKGVYEFIG